jgi:glycine cleavage system H protein
MYPNNYYYTREHEWVDVEEGVASIGITDHAQDQLGDIVYVELPEVGADLNAGDEFGSVESVKAVAEVFSPVTGEVTEINEELEDNPEKVNQSPHEDGWLIKIKLADTSELESLMNHEEYASFVEEESK